MDKVEAYHKVRDAQSKAQWNVERHGANESGLSLVWNPEVLQDLYESVYDNEASDENLADLFEVLAPQVADIIARAEEEINNLVSSTSYEFYDKWQS